MSRKTVVLLASIFGVAIGFEAVAQNLDGAIKALATIAENLQKASDEKWPLVMKCVGGEHDTYEVGRVLLLPPVNFDVQTTNSLVNPYIGLLNFRGQIATNRYSPKANGFPDTQPGAFDKTKHPTCFNTPEEALAANGEDDFKYYGGSDVIGTYVLNGSGTAWDYKEGNYDFNQIVFWASQYPNSSKWYPVLVAPIEK